jgi:hypothetical protein
MVAIDVTTASWSDIDVLLETIQRLSLARDIQTIQELVKTSARRLVAADGATFVLREGEQCFYADEDAIAPLWKGRRFPMGDCISGWVMLHRQAAAIEDIYNDPRIPQDAYRPTFVRSLAMVPIRTLNPIGAIGVYWRDIHGVTRRELSLLSALADSTSVAVEYASVHDELRSRPVPRHGELIRICAWTRRIEMDGQWVSVETYLRECLGLEVTHTISEEAYRVHERSHSDDPQST